MKIMSILILVIFSGFLAAELTEKQKIQLEILQKKIHSIDERLEKEIALEIQVRLNQQRCWLAAQWYAIQNKHYDCECKINHIGEIKAWQTPTIKNFLHGHWVENNNWLIEWAYFYGNDSRLTELPNLHRHHQEVQKAYYVKDSTKPIRRCERSDCRHALILATAMWQKDIKKFYRYEYHCAECTIGPYQFFSADWKYPPYEDKHGYELFMLTTHKNYWFQTEAEARVFEKRLYSGSDYERPLSTLSSIDKVDPDVTDRANYILELNRILDNASQKTLEGAMINVYQQSNVEPHRYVTED